MANKKPELYGMTNKVMAEINAHILANEDFGKFLYYTDKEYEEANILEQDIVPASEIYGKHYYVYKRFPEVITEAGAYVFINIYRNTPITIGGAVNSITFNVDILVHKDCMNTAHGNRIVCIYEALNHAVTECANISSIGKINLTRILPVLGIVKDFEGYTVQYEAHTFRTDPKNLGK